MMSLSTKYISLTLRGDIIH